MSPDDETLSRTDFTAIVAIGASAGGLEPLERFFAAAPADAGWCFVVVQHLSPDHKSMMDQLLARKSRLSIRHIDDGTELAPDTIFLNRPNRSVEIVDGRFRTREFEASDQLPRNPIDILFQSLARGEVGKSVAVILSGSGSDGARGAAHLHEAGGTVLVQAPAEAGFPSMPQAALATGVVEHSAKAAELPETIRAVLSDAAPPALEGERAESILRDIFRLLEARFHTDFSAYKKPSIYRRISRRQGLHGVSSLADYAELLRQSPAAQEELYQDLLIGVTAFYREEQAMAALREKVIDPLAAEQTEEPTPIRVWVPACASGEEAYTIAIELSEALEAAGSNRRFRVIATDVHRKSLDVASAGFYAEEAIAGVPAHLRQKYFRRHRDGYLVEPALRQKIIFSAHDVLSDPPFMHLDLVSCRNLFIYLNSHAQNRVLSMFLFGLKIGGHLLLGSSESVGRYDEEFQAVDHGARLFRKAGPGQNLVEALFANQPGKGFFAANVLQEEQRPVRRRGNVGQAEIVELRSRDTLIRSYNALLKRYAPPSILVTTEGVVLSWFGDAAAFVDTMNHLAEWMVEDIVHPDLHFTINVGMEKVRQGLLEPYSRSISIDTGDGEKRPFIARVEPLDQIGQTRILLVSVLPEDPAGALSGPGQETGVERFTPTDAGDGAQTEDVVLMTRRVRELERDLRLTEETLQHVTERLEASGEELQAANEELQASNEELQASNEELQGSNEELHAVNEELISLTEEHERKIDMLSELAQSTDAVFRVLRVGMIAMDGRGTIRRFTDLVGERFLLQAHDVGRPYSVVGPRIEGLDLSAVAARVIGSGQSETHEADWNGTSLEIEVHRTPPPENAAGGKPIPGAIILFRGLI
ncbi:histidine kinase [Rhodobacterales bacterium HKCCE3408]|nr:histidine kinase [Rhodobacterales bacterium HKCCE3408]